MKSVRYHLLKTRMFSFCFGLALVALFLLAHCDSNTPVPKAELEKLPPATQEGKNTFGCLVNGEAMVVNSITKLTAIYQQGIFQIGAVSNSPRYSLGIAIIEDGFTISTGDYPLDRPPFFISRFSENPCVYLPENTINGKLTITLFDKSRFVVSGLFEFSTVANTCDTIKITNGRFDLNYIP
ncbi:MAG: hypothetical protein ACOYXA_11120 [Bacteroidota bacterium]